MIDVIVTYQTVVMDVDKRLKVPCYEMLYTEQEVTATCCHRAQNLNLRHRPRILVRGLRP